MDVISIPIVALADDVVLPSYAHSGDSGMDLRSTIDFELKPFQRKLVPCGFSLAIPEGYGGFVLPRSGLASKQGVTVANAPGLIDSNYRGEVCVSLVNLDSEQTFVCSKGDRVAQLVIIATPLCALSQCQALDETDRGAGGFGSSGCK